MRFDDRLATVLRQSIAGEAIARIQYRQLLDLLGTQGAAETGEQVDSAYMRLARLSKSIPAARRAEILAEPNLRVRSTRLLSFLAEGEPAVAAAAIKSARLDDSQWADLIPALPIQARGFLRHRRDLGPQTSRVLDRLGIGDRALPAGDVAIARAEESQAPEPVTTEPAMTAPEDTPEPDGMADTPQPSTTEADIPREVPAAIVRPVPPAPVPAEPRQSSEAIGAIVRRIEAFRKSREQQAVLVAANDPAAPRLPLGEDEQGSSASMIASFDFSTDAHGRIDRATQAAAPMVVGLALASDKRIAATLARRQPVRGALMSMDGATAIAGQWQVDATPRFSPASGQFIGYLGRMRRAAQDVSPVAQPLAEDDNEDRMRQILHELRTPVNAIQGFAELIQQQLFGPTPHEYRALAASIASDAAHILAGFDELDRLVKLRAGALAFEPGTCDFAAVVESTARQLEAYTAKRQSGFALAVDSPLHVAMPEDEARRMAWRLMATLAGAASPGEKLKLRLKTTRHGVRMSVRLPSTLALRDDEALFSAAVPGQAQALASGMFGAGFALRLVAAEVEAAAGTFERRHKRLRIALPFADGETAVNGDEIKTVHCHNASS